MRTRCIVGLTPAAEDAVVDWFKDHSRDPLVDRDALIQEVLSRVSDRIPGEHEPTYELSGFLTRDGNPRDYSFSDDDFVWEEIEIEE